MDLNLALSRACQDVPGLLRAALVLLPDGLLIAGIGAGSVFDHEPLARSAAHCLAPRDVPLVGDRAAAAFVEYLFVIEEELVVIEAGRRDPRLGLVVVCKREVNLGMLLSSSRAALRNVEDSVDLVALGV